MHQHQKYMKANGLKMLQNVLWWFSYVFYFFISRDRGYLEGVSHLIERYLEYFNPAIQHAANLEYRNYLEKKEISPAYILNEATVAR
jgi:hypothetical protein